MSKKGWAVAGIAFVSIVGSCTNEDSSSSTPPTSPTVSASSPSGSSPSTPRAIDDSSVGATGTAAVAVTRVVDGDTFEIAGGQRVRVLGIDSCKLTTYGGKQAKQSAEAQFGGQQVVLTAEPGVDRDRYGQLLRYVATTSGNDFGELMVSQPHTGVYEGSTNASPHRLAELRGLDAGGRDCTAPDTTTPSDTSSDTTSGGSFDGPTPGDQGLPDGLLTGGYCARKWWC